MGKTIKSQIQEEMPELTNEMLEKICMYVRKEISYEDRIARLEAFMDFITRPQITPVR